MSSSTESLLGRPILMQELQEDRAAIQRHQEPRVPLHRPAWAPSLDFRSLLDNFQFDDDSEYYKQFACSNSQGRATGYETICKVWEWTERPTVPYDINHPGELQQIQGKGLRIILCEPDLPNQGSALTGGLLALFQHFQVPSTFLLERITNVAHSFGYKPIDQSNYSAWFHYLCEDIAVKKTDDGAWDYAIENQNVRSGEQSESTGESHGWHRAAFFLKSERNLTTLICFNRSLNIEPRLRRLQQSPMWTAAVEDPFCVFVVVLDEIFIQIHYMVENLRKVFGGIEKKILRFASKHKDSRAEINFSELHHVARHVIYMVEAVDAMIHTVEAMISKHKAIMVKPGTGNMVQANLHHRKSLFSSLKLQVGSLDRKVGNAISLGFNIVAQMDSQTMLDDSRSMRKIGVMTFVFLPVSAVATIFGSQVFIFADDQEWQDKTFRVHPRIWVLFGVSAILTAVVTIIWWFSHKLKVTAYFRKWAEKRRVRKKEQQLTHGLGRMGLMRP